MAYGTYSYGSAAYGGASGSYLIVEVASQSLSLSIKSVGIQIVSSPSTIAGVLSIKAPVTHITKTADNQTTTLTVYDANINIYEHPATHALTLSLKSPNCSIAHNHVIPRLTMLVKQPTKVRYIYNPVVTGGCPQCGSYLYHQEIFHNNPVGLKRNLRSKGVNRGRNFDKGRLKDKKYVRCEMWVCMSFR